MTENTKVIESIETIAEETDVSVKEVIDLLTGFCWDEEDAGGLKDWAARREGMRYLTIDGFVKSFEEQQLWQMLDDYDKWQLEPYECYHDNCLLMQSTKEYCSNNHISFCEIDLYVGMITTQIYKYFAMKYKETLNDPDSH